LLETQTILTVRNCSISLQERDVALLRGLFESRVMTTGHIATLHFDGKKEAAKKRLQKLKAAQLLGERTQRVNEPSVLFLTRQAFTLLESEGVLKEYPPIAQSSLEKRARVSDLTLRHELEVMDVKAAFHSAIRKTELFSTAEFSTWPLLNQFEAFRDGHSAAEVLVKPDGFIRIHEKEKNDGLSEHTFFLELDRSTETQDTLVTRAGCYFDYYKSGGFAVRNGAPRSDYKAFPFRVLMVFKNAERRNNTAERLLQNNPPIFTHACLSTFEEVTTDPLGPIWIQPVDYRDATKGTQFDSGQRRETWGYKRQSAREEFVERNVKKLRILVSEPECVTATTETPR
jgi:Replication-relaxation